MATILVTGASGFVGSHVLPQLEDAGHAVRALVRSDASLKRVLDRLLLDRGSTGVEFVKGDVTDPASLVEAVDSVDAVYHLVAIPRDRSGGRELELVNTTGTRNLVRAMSQAGVRRLVHQSALGVTDEPHLHYARSKARGEKAVQASELDWTILRPSLLFGERDGFFNLIADLVRISPVVVPAPARQRSRFQPLFVGDLARIVVAVLSRPETVGQAYDLGGPEHWTYREMAQEVVRAMDKERFILPVPLPLIKLVAGGSERLGLPFPVATDQLRQLARDNATALNAVPASFGFAPRSMRGALGYVARPRKEQDRRRGATAAPS